MVPALIVAASLAALFVAWYLCGRVPSLVLRAVLRATSIALLLSPGILVGHGFAAVPGLFALWVQPSIFTFAPMLVVWVIALAVVLGIPALRERRSAWPPAAAEIFLAGHPAKFVLFGLIAAALMLALIRADTHTAFQYGLFFAGALANLVLCQGATRRRQAHVWVTPLWFAGPVLLAAAPIASFTWYGAGVIGGLIASGRRRAAAWAVLGVFALLAAVTLFRAYSAATAPSHVTIEGGAAGNAAMATGYAVIGVLAWYALRRGGARRN